MHLQEEEAVMVGCGIKKNKKKQSCVDPDTAWPLEPQKSHLLTLWYLSRRLTITVNSYILLCSPTFSHHPSHPIPGWPTNHCLPFHEDEVCCIARVFFHPVPYMERMCSLHSKDDWAELNGPVLSCVQSNQLKSSWLRWTHFTIIYTRRAVDTAAQLTCSCTVASIEH